MILIKYVTYRFLQSLAITFIVIALISLLGEVIEQVRRFGDANITFQDSLLLALFKTPEGLYRIAPLWVSLSTLVMCVAMARRSELVAIRAAGNSGFKILIGPALAAFVIGILLSAVFNPLVILGQKKYEAFLNANIFKQPDDAQIKREGFWLRDMNDETQTIIHFLAVNEPQHQIENATFFLFGENGKFLSRTQASKAVFESGTWRLRHAKVWDFIEPGTTSKPKPVFNKLIKSTNIEWQQVVDAANNVQKRNFWQLPAYIKDLEKAGLSSDVARTRFQMDIAQPFLLAAMVIGAATLTMGHTRSQKRNIMIATAVFASFAIFFFRNMIEVLGKSGDIPANVAAWVPPIFAMLIALSLMLHMEDG